MTVNYIDSAELMEVLGLENNTDLSPLDYLKIFKISNLLLKLQFEELNSKDISDISKIRNWLDLFIKKNKNGVGVAQNYITVWESISGITDDSCFLKLMAANIYLMWD